MGMGVGGGGQRGVPGGFRGPEEGPKGSEGGPEGDPESGSDGSRGGSRGSRGWSGRGSESGPWVTNRVPREVLRGHFGGPEGGLEERRSTNFKPREGPQKVMLKLIIYNNLKIFNL